MNKNVKEILLIIEKELIENEGARFTQVLFNLGINKFANEEYPSVKDYLLRDNYNDSDASVLDRIKKCKNPEEKPKVVTETKVGFDFNRQIVRNMAQCLKCNDVITSYHGHDYTGCSCGAIAVDGGANYLKRAGELSDCKELTFYSDAPFEVIRENFHRGGRGKDGTMPLTWTPMDKMSNAWLENCITYNEDGGQGDSFASKMYKKELEYRKENNIFIEE